MADWQDKYEKVVNELQKEFQDTVLKAQEQAERNATASQEIISSLKEELNHREEELKQKEEELKQREDEISQLKAELDKRSLRKRQQQPAEINTSELSPDTSSAKRFLLSSSDDTKKRKIDFYEIITCIAVELKEDDHVYHCIVEDGSLAGHEFEMEYISDLFEYQYRPIKMADNLGSSDELSESLAIPDYMLPKFLMMLLNKTYINKDKPPGEVIVLTDDDDN